MKTIITKIQANDQSAFAELFHHFHGAVYHFILRYVHSEETAKELTQILFVKIWEKRQMLSLDKPIESQIFLIARNLTIDELRKLSRERNLHRNFQHFNSSSINNTEDAILFSNLQEHVDSAVNELPVKRRKIYQLSRDEGLTYNQISEKLSISPKTVEAQMSLALKTLRIKLNAFLHTFL